MEKTMVIMRSQWIEAAETMMLVPGVRGIEHINTEKELLE